MVTDGELAGAAREAMKNAYAPYSGFRVGAAALTDSGRIYTGTNVENASYGLTICAERVAVFKAVSEGHSGITRVAVVSSSGEMTFPCGACRQVINEFAPAAQIITADSSGQVRRHNIETLLPNAFGPQNLKG
ncbi:MAG: cytidine deaminase [Nitrospinae bacterium]|nr:cytidine deaminase [Nitrospinota bacterium]